MTGLATVASGHPVTTAAAREVIEAGGNAFDGVVAAAFCSSVVEPMLTSVAGGGFCLTRTADGTARMVDFFVDVPGLGDPARPVSDVGAHMVDVDVAFTATTQRFSVGWPSLATPGCLTGWLHVHEHLGRLPLVDVLAPAVAAATDGVEVNEQQAYLLRILAPINATDPVTAARFVPDGTPLPAGSLLRQPDVAEFLRSLADDTDSTIAAFRRALADACRAGGGAVTIEDLGHHEVVDREPLEGRFRDAVVLTNPPPAEGGRLVVAQLTALAETHAVDDWDDEQVLCRIIDAQLVADAMRAPASAQGTTHVTVADQDGNVATMTTSNGSGSGCTVPGFGVLCNNMLGEDDLFPAGLGEAVPGRRVSSMMSPTIVLEHGQVVLALGSGGSKRIRTAISQVVARALDHHHELGLDSVVSAPRVHWDGALVQVEPGHPGPALGALRARHPVHEWDDLDLYFGGVHAVRPGREAAGDPRRGGSAAAFEPPRP